MAKPGTCRWAYMHSTGMWTFWNDSTRWTAANPCVFGDGHPGPHKRLSDLPAPEDAQHCHQTCAPYSCKHPCECWCGDCLMARKYEAKMALETETYTQLEGPSAHDICLILRDRLQRLEVYSPRTHETLQELTNIMIEMLDLIARR